MSNVEFMKETPKQSALQLIARELQNLPDDAKLWIYQADEPFDDKSSNILKNEIDLFVKGWQAHGKSLAAAGTFLYNRFLVLGVDEKQARASGCSIDSSVSFVKEMEKKFGAEFFNRQILTYWEGENIIQKPLSELASLHKSGTVKDNSFVFNNLVNTPNEMKREWILPLAESWHKNFV